MLERGVLARIDSRVRAELDHREGIQLVKVPVSEAVWSTWRRYCEVAGISMGRGIAALIEHELGSAVDEEFQLDGPVLGGSAVPVAAELTAGPEPPAVAPPPLLAGHELPQWDLAGVGPSRTVKVGRNERCPCGSGLKYKHCHSRQ
jgi:hypothetical protein